MGRKKISIEQLRAEVDDILREYSDDLEAKTEKLSVQYAKIAKSELQSSSPKKTGHYAKGWAYKKTNTKKKKSTTVHNKTDYQLTHLLEFGHALRNGGRAKAMPHIAAVEEEVCNDFLDAMESELS